MKRLFLLIIIGLALAALFTAALSLDPGYVRISIGHWLIETNLWMLLFANILILTITALSLSLLAKLVRSGSIFSSWLGQSSHKRANKRTQQGLIAYLEGNWAEASRLLSRSAGRSDTPLVNYLAAAHASSAQGNLKDAEALLKKAYEKSSDSDFAVGIAQAQIQLDKNQLEACLATLLRLKKQHPAHPLVTKLLRSVYLKLEDWQQIIHLLPQLRKLPNEDPAVLRDIEDRAWTHLFQLKSEELQRNGKRKEAANELAQMWKQLPNAVRFKEVFLDNYAQQLQALGHNRESETLVRKMLNKEWSEKLVLRYGLIEGENLSEQLLTAEKWLKERPNSAGLMLTLGRLALRNELWGKALEYFEASNKLQPSQESFGELVRLSSRMSDKPDQNRNYFDGLIASLRLPDLPLPK